ncbi:MAG: biotin--[acetyl-CoA-carboxylase] ligase [Alistipes sp.]|nr:biotin--[acetyl-CoA-carboxylase] ligase [Alistipes sp.]
MIYRFDILGSTNDEARNALYGEGDVVIAEHQTAGRGQRGHTWESAVGENLTFSLILEPRFLPVNEQFLLTEVLALGLVDTLAEFGIEARIKWTNDIYVGDKKIVGMLVENSLGGGCLARTIAGIGLNVNQTEFDPSLPNPTSMSLVAGREFDREEVLARLHHHIMALYEALRCGEKAMLQSRYRSTMYRLGEMHPYALADGTIFEGIIRGVRPSGELQIEHSADGTLREYLFKQVEFVIKK